MSSMMVVVVDEEALISLMTPNQSVGKSRCSIWALAVVHRGKSQYSVLYSAPPIPAGIRSFQWNSGGIHRNPVIPVEFHWNKNGIKQTKVAILIYLSQFLKLCRYIHFSLFSLPFLHKVHSCTLPLKFNFK